MSDPAVVAPAGLIALMAELLGPLAGEYAVVLVIGLAGALLALAAAKTTRWQAVVMLLRLMLTSIARRKRSAAEAPAVEPKGGGGPGPIRQ